ncbi:MAG: hypothetical protein KDD15_29140, partial [Lewinella sp.]|nr:hypothetical protein [Lewinella sp.]
MSENNNISRFENPEDTIDVQELIWSILRNWYWIILCLVVGFLGARLYLRYTEPIYRASGTILIKDREGNSSGLTEEAVLQEIGLFKPGSNVNNEIEILKSRSLMQEVIDQLGLDVQYLGLGRLKDTEHYNGTSPILMDSVHWGRGRENARLEVEIKDDDTFSFFNTNNTGSAHRFGEPLIVNQDTFWLSRNSNGNNNSRLLLRIGGGPGIYLQKLEIKAGGDYSSVLNLQIEDPVPQKASDIINKLIEVYNQEAINDKNQVAEKTLKFIDERLILLTDELNSVESGLETYKERNEISVEATSTVGLILNEISQYDNELSEQQVKLELLETVETILKNNVERYELIPANVVLQDASGLDAQISGYNTLVLNRERLQNSAGTENTQLHLLDQQLANIQANILNSVQSLKESIEISIQKSQEKLDQLQRRISQVPRQERELLEIKRQQNIKEALYLYLLQKKEETALSAAVTVPNARVIDPAITSAQPISPKPLQIYAVFLMLGFVLPVGVIFLREMLDNKIYNESEIQGLTQTPILGTIGLNKSGQPIVVKAGSRTGIAEMFRLLRTNLNYLAGGKKQQSILVTSGMAGDGKTFIAVNLGISLALVNKKVILLGMDLRKPKLAKYLLNIADVEGPGITNYLVEDIKLEQLIYSTDIHEGLYFIPSGPIPPNPAELLSGTKTQQLFTELRKQF